MSRIAPDITALIGNTPLMRLGWASAQTGCEILGKAEFLNPGGSVKDRAGLAIVEAAETDGSLKPGGMIVEGTAGNTGIGLALVGRARGYPCVIVMPETQSIEKQQAIRAAGAELMLVPAAPYSNPNNFVHVAERLAAHLKRTHPAGAIWARQFDNTANRDGHEATTGPEIWDQTGGKLDAFTCAVGTGGTLAGVARALKSRDPSIRIVLADPHGAALYSWIKTGALAAEGGSVTEGIGQGRVTDNLADAPIDDALRISDDAAMETLFNTLQHDGLALGGSAALNVTAAMQVAQDLGPGHRVVTILCDLVTRYQSKLLNPEFLQEKSLPCPDWLTPTDDRLESWRKAVMQD
ncbi:MAG: cysteine synthase A [Alphaproteobacteria bacterium]